MSEKRTRKKPVNWTIDEDIWNYIQSLVQKASQKAGVEVSVSSIANKVLRKGMERDGKES